METVATKEAGVTTDLGFVWGTSPAVQALNTMVMELAPTRIPLILIGESGTGKEIYARVIHRLSEAEAFEFRKISCTGMEALQLREEILRSTQAKDGRVATLFLDEIEELNQECQRLLVKALPEGEFRGSGGQVRARLISATTANLEKEVEMGRFRRELYFRIDGAALRLPPLRERKEDIEELAKHFLRKQAEELKKTTPGLNGETAEQLAAYHWPGNIRELENVTRKMVVLGDSNMATTELRETRMVPLYGMSEGKRSSLKVAVRAASRQTERELILQALQRTKWNRKRAARELQISYKSFLYKLKQIETLGTKSEK